MLTEIDVSITRLFVGTQLTESETDQCECTACNRTLREGEYCTVYTTHSENTTSFHFIHLYCRECAPDAITTPTQGVSEYLLDSRLASTRDASTQRSFPTLLSVDLVATSPSNEGSADRTQGTIAEETEVTSIPPPMSGHSGVTARPSMGDQLSIPSWLAIFAQR